MVFIHLDEQLLARSRNAKRSTQAYVNGPLNAKFDLAPIGVYLAAIVANDAGALLPHPFNFTEGLKPPQHSSTRTVGSNGWLSALCCTFLQVTLTGRYPAICPMELGLSSNVKDISEHPITCNKTT